MRLLARLAAALLTVGVLAPQGHAESTRPSLVRGGVEQAAAIAARNRSAIQKGAVTYSASTMGGPVWNRPVSSCDGLSDFATAVPYQVQPFTVGASGSYTIASVQDFDGYLLIYSGDFDPTSPLANCVTGNDDDGVIGRSRVESVSLAAGTTHFVVTTGFGNGDFGSFTNDLSGPGAISLGDGDGGGGGGGGGTGPVVLTFEGLQNLEPVADFYAGGAGGAGSRGGENFGVSFGQDALAIIDEDAGGSGNFGGEPSPDTVLFFLEGSAVMNVPAGFDTGFAFFYSAVNEPGEVVVYEGLDASGPILARVSLPLTTPDGGDPTGDFSPFFPVGVPFSGTARSVDFSGVVDQIGFDNITFGSSTPGGDAVIGISQILPDACPRVQAVTTVVAGGTPVSGLTDDNFTVIDEGIAFAPDVETVVSGGSAATVALVFDVSGSMAGQAIADAQEAAIAFVELLGVDDRVGLFTFSDAVTFLTPFSADKTQIVAAISGLVASGGTAFYDAVVEASLALQREPGRKAIVAFTDGEDGASASTLDDAIAAANQAGVPVTAIGFGSANTAVLTDLASQTSGLFFNGADSGALQEILSNIGAILNNQYLVTWDPDLSQPGTRMVEIAVTTPTASSRDTATYDASLCAPANSPPSAAFDVSVRGLTVAFFDRSSDEDGAIAARAWNFGDGATSSLRDPTHTYALPGTYPVTLRVTDDGGLAATVTQQVSVDLDLPPPQAVPTPPNIGAGDRLGSSISGGVGLFAVGAPEDSTNGPSAGLVAPFRIENGQSIVEPALEIPPGFVTGRFGASLDQQGMLLTVGAPEAAAVARNQKGLTSLGAAVYERLNLGWRFKGPLAPVTPSAPADEFGAAVAFDGETYLVGAPGADNGSGTAYVFRFDGANFVQTAQINPPTVLPGQRFGSSVAVSAGKGAIGAIGAPISGVLGGAVTLVDQITANLRNLGTITASETRDGDDFGASVSLEGDRLVVGAPGNDADGADAGTAWVFDFRDRASERGRIVPSDPVNSGAFGTSVKLNAGNILVGAPGARTGGQRNGAVYLYRPSGAVPRAKGFDAGYTLTQKIEPPPGQRGFGTSVAAAGGNVYAGAPDTGPNSGGAAVTAGLRSANKVLSPVLEVDPRLGCPGFYIGRVSTSDVVGRWSMEILLEPGLRPLLQGGLNLGGGYADATRPGFAAFNIANAANEPQRVSIDLQVIRDDPEAAYTIRIIERTNGENNVVFEAQRRGVDTLFAERILDPGFYAVEVFTYDAPPGVDDRGIFLLSLLTQFVDRPGGAFQGGVNVGGLLDPSLTNSGRAEGFGAFCIDARQQVRFTTFGDDAFGAAGVPTLNLEVLDRDRAVVVGDP